MPSERNAAKRCERSYLAYYLFFQPGGTGQGRPAGQAKHAYASSLRSLATVLSFVGEIKYLGATVRRIGR